MQQVAGMDGMFLSIDQSETASAVMGGLIVLGPSSDPEAGSLARVRTRIAQRLDRIPPLRWVKASVPVGINNAYWTEVDQLDVRAHTRQVPVPAPGTEHELAATVARLMQVPLARGRPLWEYVVLTGLSEGRVAHLLRIHHGLVDGSMVPLIVNLLSDHPTVAADPRDSRGAAGGHPSTLRLAARGVVNTAMTPVRMVVLQAKTSVFLAGRVKADGPLFLPAYLARMLPGTFARPLTAIINGQQRLFGRPQVKSVVPVVRAPSSPFNGKITQRRSFAFADLPMHDVKALAKARGATLNDVVVSCCAGALRRYLLSLGEVPTEPLIVCIPYSVRGDDDKQRWANHITTIFAEFPTNVDDPVQRLHTVREEVKSARENVEALPTHLLREASNFIPQAFWNLSVRLVARTPDWLPGASWNVVVANLRGPAKPLALTGAPVTGLWPVAFLTPGVGLNITVQSYTDRLCLGVMGCPDLLPDLGSLPGHFLEAVAELASASGVGSSPSDRVAQPAHPHRAS
ncbi:MAG: wax ester/triacylglycerol synthase family O-acyltransferase [Dermatophilaceae bacterium]